MRNLVTSYPWSPNCLENFSVLMLQMKVSKCWKKLNFRKLQLEGKIVKHFMRPKQRAALKKFFRLPPTHSPPDKILLRLWSKNFLIDIYRNIQIFAFKVLQGCSSWASRNGAVQMFFLKPNRNMFAGKVKKVFPSVARAYYFQCQVKISMLRFVKQVRFLEWNCIVKQVTFSASFCWLWDFLPENLKFKKKKRKKENCLIMSTRTCAWNNI